MHKGALDVGRVKGFAYVYILARARKRERVTIFNILCDIQLFTCIRMRRQYAA